MQNAVNEQVSSGWVSIGPSISVELGEQPRRAARPQQAAEEEPEFQSDDDEDDEEIVGMDEEGRVRQALRAQAQRDIAALVATITAIDDAERCLCNGNDSLKLPVTLTHGSVRLRDHQIAGVQWMWQRWQSGLGGCVLADEMGLGKTAQALGLLAALHDRHCVARRARAKAGAGAIAVRRSFSRPVDWDGIPLLSKPPDQVTCLDLGVLGPHLIIAPTSLVSNWAAEAKRFAGRMRCLVLRGSRAERKLLISRVRAHPGRFHLVVTSFSMIEDADVFAALRVSLPTLQPVEKALLALPPKTTAPPGFHVHARVRAHTMLAGCCASLESPGRRRGAQPEKPTHSPVPASRQRGGRVSPPSYGHAGSKQCHRNACAFALDRGGAICVGFFGPRRSRCIRDRPSLRSRPLGSRC